MTADEVRTLQDTAERRRLLLLEWIKMETLDTRNPTQDQAERYMDLMARTCEEVTGKKRTQR